MGQQNVLLHLQGKNIIKTIVSAAYSNMSLI